MSSGVVSATDYFERLRLGPERFSALVRSRSRSMSRMSFEDELAVRDARVAELQRGVMWRRPTTPAAPPPRKPKPAWSATSPGTKAKYPWSVVLRPQATRRFDICLQGDASWQILRDVRHVMGEDIETGGHLWARERARSCSADIVYASGAGVPGQLHGHRSMKLPREDAARTAMPDFVHPDEMLAVGDWHLHPGGDATPSRADIDSWASVLYSRERSRLFEWGVADRRLRGPARSALPWLRHAPRTLRRLHGRASACRRAVRGVTRPVRRPARR
jgi:hypothetical protein